MTFTPPPSASASTPVFQPIVSGDALAAEAHRFATQLGHLSPEEVANRTGWTLGIIAGALALLWLLRFSIRLVARWLSPKQDQEDERGKEARRQIGGWTMSAARFVVGMFALGWILYVWGFDVRAGALGQVLGVIWRAGIIIILAVAALEISTFVITRGLHRGARHARDVRRAAQLRTLAPVLKAMAQSLIILIATMMTLSQFGVEIAPLIAGAGIIGLAIGFGAQTLVKDFLTGIFMILEDTVSIGDVVTIGNYGGVVEDMSLRTIKLRDFDGTLHIFPFSEAQVIHNKTKSFSYAVFDLSVTYSADIGRALQVMRETGEQLAEDEGFSQAIVAPIEIVGVDRLADSGVILKGRFKTMPGQQWTVQREYLRRIKQAFDENSIFMPTPAPQVRLVSAAELSARQTPTNIVDEHPEAQG
ncbi:MAG: mechanosensitive ion channel family protein [Hyphomonadaceae bacterium]|nr:mechanosensitive ion channel family protein [Hyphomonadaceae bacterium]